MVFNGLCNFLYLAMIEHSFEGTESTGSFKCVSRQALEYRYTPKIGRTLTVSFVNPGDVKEIDLLKTKNVGPKTIRKLIAVLEAHGVKVSS